MLGAIIPTLVMIACVSGSYLLIEYYSYSKHVGKAYAESHRKLNYFYNKHAFLADDLSNLPQEQVNFVRMVFSLHIAAKRYKNYRLIKAISLFRIAVVDKPRDFVMNVHKCETESRILFPDLFGE